MVKTLFRADIKIAIRSTTSDTIESSQCPYDIDDWQTFRKATGTNVDPSTEDGQFTTADAVNIACFKGQSR